MARRRTLASHVGLRVMPQDGELHVIKDRACCQLAEREVEPLA